MILLQSTMAAMVVVDIIVMIHSPPRRMFWLVGCEDFIFAIVHTSSMRFDFLLATNANKTPYFDLFEIDGIDYYYSK